MEDIIKALRWFIIPFFAIFLMSHNVSAYTAKPISVNSLEYYGTYTAQANAGLASNCELEAWPYVSQNGCNNSLANGIFGCQTKVMARGIFWGAQGGVVEIQTLRLIEGVGKGGGEILD